MRDYPEEFDGPGYWLVGGQWVGEGRRDDEWACAGWPGCAEVVSLACCGDPGAAAWQ